MKMVYELSDHEKASSTNGFLLLDRRLLDPPQNLEDDIAGRMTG
jgi:hypothetical protein